MLGVILVRGWQCALDRHASLYRLFRDGERDRGLKRLNGGADSSALTPFPRGKTLFSVSVVMIAINLLVFHLMAISSPTYRQF